MRYLDNPYAWVQGSEPQHTLLTRNRFIPPRANDNGYLAIILGMINKGCVAIMVRKELAKYKNVHQITVMEG